MSTYLGQANLQAKAYFARPGVATLAAISHTTGDLHKPGETNSIGLVMMGAVEFVSSRDITPSGTNREYGYWRGGYNKTFLNKFDQAFFPLEGSGLYAGVPQVTITKKASGTGEAEGGTCADGVGEAGCTWLWDGAEWDLYADMCAEGGKPGCGCEGTNPTTGGDFPMEMRSFDCVGGTTAGSAGGVGNNVGYAEWAKAGTLTKSLGQQAPQQRSLFLSKRSFISAGSGIDLSSSRGYSVYAKVVPSGDITGTVVIAQHREDPAQFILGCDYDGRYYVRSDHAVSGVNNAVYAKSEKGFEDYQYPAHVVGVYASGDSRLRIYVNGKEEGISAPFIRDKKRASTTNVVLGKREFGLAERGFTGWVDEAGVSSASFEPSEIKKFHDNTFNVTDLIFNSKVTPISSDQSTATITFTGVPVVDQTIILIDTAGTSKTYTAKAAESATALQFNQSGTAAAAATSLKACIEHGNGHNGNITVVDNGSGKLTLTQLVVGAEGNTAITSNLTNTTITPFTGGVQSGLSGRDFGDTGVDALNADFVQFVVDSGVVGDLNPTGAKGGAYDQEMWGQANQAISSVLTFDLTEVPTRFHQLTDLSVDMWVEHATNHPSGADLSVRLIHKDRQITRQNLRWHPSGVSIPSGSKRLLSITHPLEYESYYRGGNPSFRNDFDDHQLEVSLKYPKSNLPYDAEFRIYSSKLSFGGFDSLAKYNTKDGLIEKNVIKGHSITDIDGNLIAQATGDRSLTMYSFGGAPTLSSGIMNMFVDVGTADQALNLTLNHDPVSSMGDTGSGFLFANAAIALENGHRATATIAFTGAAVVDETITIIDSRGFSRTYTAKGSTSAGDREFINTDAAAAATALKSCIDNAAGHNGSITVVDDGAGGLTLTQKDAGAAGNTTITESLTNATATNFTGGQFPLRQMNLYTKAGSFTSTMPLFVKQRSFTGLTSPSLQLEIAGTELSFPRSQKILPLHLLGSPGFGVPSGDMILVMPNTKAPLQFANRLLYIRGKQPVADISLYLEVSEPLIKTTTLFTKGPLTYAPSGIMNMFVKQKDFYGVSYIKAVPTIVDTANTQLFMKGYGVAGLATGTQATGTVTITDFTELNSTDKVNLIATDGTNYDFANGDQSSVAGTWESTDSNDQTATNLMNVINTSSGPAGTRFSASVVGAVVTITQNTSGPDGNTAITLTDTGSVGMTKTDFTGGAEPTRTMNLAMPNILGSGTKTFNLSTRGFEA